MNVVRVLINLGVSAACSAGGIYLLTHGSLFLRDRHNPAVGLLFTGPALYCLALALFCLAGFATAVAIAWFKGWSPMPGAAEIRPHPAYKGQLLVKYWYLVGPAAILTAAAFMMARQQHGPF